MAPKKTDRLDHDDAATTWALERGVLRITVRTQVPGPVVNEVLQILEERLLRHDVTSPVRAVVDIRDSRFSPSGQEIRVGAMKLGELDAEGRIGLLVADDFQFGLVRMFGLLASGTDIDVQPFRDEDEAARWLAGEE